MIIREIMISDAEDFLKLTQKVEATSEYMLWEAGERKADPKRQRNFIENIQKNNNSTIIVAQVENSLVGYVVAIGGNARRNKHSAYLVVGILEEYRGKGIGSKLFLELEKWAIEKQIHRLELTVVTRNKAGISLYRKMGLEIEGVKRDSLLIGGEFVDEYYMSKLIIHK